MSGDSSLACSSNVNAKLTNPMKDTPQQRLLADVEVFARERGLTHILPELKKGALVAQDPDAYLHFDIFSDEDRFVLEDEKKHKWRQTGTLYYMVIMSSLAAAVQGMDEAVINGAQLIYPEQFGIDTSTCMSTASAYEYRFLTYLFQPMVAVTNSWWHLFIARFFLGIGIGPKSATVPVYAAECSPAAIRGALVMMWQMWTAFGIFFGNVADLAFYYIPDSGGVRGLNWRLM
ncbi:hypothetical protein ID866_10218, partial [Astraeus odoratus]